MMAKLGWALAGLLVVSCAQKVEPQIPDAPDAQVSADGGGPDGGPVARAPTYLQLGGGGGQAESSRYRIDLTVGSGLLGASPGHRITVPGGR